MDWQEEAAKMVIESELRKAELKHPEFPNTVEGMAAIIAEEFLELMRAVNDREENRRLIEEASHVAVTSIRMLEKLIESEVKIK